MSAYRNHRRNARALLTLVGLVLTCVRCADTATATVNVATLELTPPSVLLEAGQTTTLAARALDANGTVISAPVLRWSSSDNSIATVSATGVVTTTAAGTARIAVSSLGRSAVATITVTPRAVASLALTPVQATVLVTGNTRLSAVPLDATGAPLSGRNITWSSSDVTVARIDASGTVTGVAPGAATMTATCEGRTAQAAVTVALPPVQSVSLTPTRDTLAVNGSRQFTATLRDANGTTLTGRTVIWSTDNVAVAIASATGAVTALTPGVATLSATSEGRTATATIVVLARLASAVTVTPGVASLVVGNTLTLTTQITDAAGNILTGRPISFSSESPSVATVSAAGVVSAISPGVTRVLVTSEGRTGQAVITVLPVPVASVEMTPATFTLVTGDLLTMMVVARAAGGALLPGRSIEWRSGAPNVATVSATGLVSAVAPGTTIVLATVEGVTASSMITVRLPAVASVTLSPTTAIVDVGQAVQLSATPRTAGGNALANRVVTWSSSNEQVAFVSSTGLVVGVRTGTAVITATSEGVSASTNISVR